MTKKETTGTLAPRSPIIVIMGHIDHGKSSLLDFIRKSNVVAGEAGGITQHLGAYEALWNEKKITFIDTPGHAAFTGMRERGASVADIAILIVSATEGVKAQTLEALKTIQAAKIPFIVALNKTDRPESDPNKVKQQLAEAEVFVEGYGGTVPCVLISAKTGDGINELLDTILLVAEMEAFTAHPDIQAEGVVIEAHLDPKRGASGMCIVRDGTLRSGSYIVIDDAISPVRILENFLGKPVKEVGPSSPARLFSLSKVPQTASLWKTFASKKEAEQYLEETRSPASVVSSERAAQTTKVVIPIVVKTDALGTLEALTGEIAKLETEAVIIKIVSSGAGPITEGDIKTAIGAKDPIVIGFHVKIEKGARDLADMHGIRIELFDIIYKASEMLETEVAARRPRVLVEETIGKARVLKLFSRERDKQILGGVVLSGVIALGKTIKIIRQEHEIAKGRVVELQQQKAKAKEVEAPKQFGAMIESKISLAEGDILETFDTIEK